MRLTKLFASVTFLLALALTAAKARDTQTVAAIGTSVAAPNSQDGTYVFGRDDQFVIRALHAEEISDKPLRVGPDGYVTVPMVGNVKVEGLTVAALESELVTRLRKYFVAPEVTISISDYRSQPVSVVGAVTSPGVHQLQGSKTLLEVLSTAGGPRADAGPIVRITRKLKWGEIPLPGAHHDISGENSVAELNLRDLLAQSDPGHNIKLFPEDVISIPTGGTVYVLGQVKKAGGFVLGNRSSMSVLEALSLAEGLDVKAYPSHAKILHPLIAGQATREEVPVNLTEILKGKAPDIQLGPSDVLFVPNSAARGAAIRTLDAAIQIGTGVAIFH